MSRRVALAFCLLLLGAALTRGALPSGADFVASSAHSASSFATATVFNTVTVTTEDPGSPLAGAVTLGATAGSSFALASVRIQRSPAGAGTWTDVCSDAVAPFSCEWDTTGDADGLYDLRSIALDSGGYTQTSATIASRRVDNTAPTASLTDPGSPLTGTPAIDATATDPGGSGVASVRIEYRTGAGPWTEICTKSAAPYSCAWNTVALADGLHDLRSTTTDDAGNATTSAVVTDRRVDNTAPAVTVTDPGAPVRGSITVETTTSDGAGSGVQSVLIQRRPAGAGAWTTICTAPGAPFECALNTTTLADGLYDLRAVATDGAALATTSATVVVQVDNTVPSAAAMTNPGTPLSNSVTLNGTATDAVGLASMRFEYKLSAGSTWATACTDSTPPSPFSCTFATTTVADGAYDFRAIATDLAGNTRTTASATSRIIDNGGPATVLADPGTPLRQTRTLTATATDVSGVQSVAFQYAPAGSGTWTTICTDPTSAYTCAWNTTTVVDGAYDLRTLATDTLGKQSTSTVVTARAVNNTSPAPVDVQVTRNGSNDRVGADDVIFTYSQTMLPGSILAGWSGASTAISVRLIDNGATDTMDFYNAANTTRLSLTAPGSGLQLNADHVAAAGAVFNANIVRSGATVTVSITTARTGASLAGDKPEVALVWTPSTAATNAAGLACLPIVVTESGTADEDF